MATLAIGARASGLAPAWRRPIVALGVTWLAVVLLFARDLADMVGIWWNDSSYGHCLFVPVIIAWLVWQRRRELAALTPAGWWPGLFAVAAGGALWLLGWAGGIAIVRHAALIAMLAASVPALLGAHVARGLLFPMAYGVFMIPAGDELVQPLQMLTAEMATGLLTLFGVPYTADGVLIRIPGAWFEVAEACAGANFVIAMTAYAVLAAHIGFRSWQKRAMFLAFAIATPVLANGVRAFATIWIAWLTDVNVAAGIDHVVYGWFFFAIVVAFVVAVSWRFFDRPIDDPAFDPADLIPDTRRGIALPVAAALTALLLAVPVAWAARGDARAANLPAHLMLPDVPGWTRVPAGGLAWSPNFTGADLRLQQRYRDFAGREVDLAVTAFARQGEGRELVGFAQGAVPPGWIWTSEAPAATGFAGVRMTGERGVVRIAWTGYRVGAMTTSSERSVKLQTIAVRLGGGAPGAAAVVLSAEEGAGGDAAITDFARALGPIAPLADSARGL